MGNMKSRTQFITVPLLTCCVMGTSIGADSAMPGRELQFSLQEEPVLNCFFRQHEVAAHLLLRSGQAARLLIAFPAGNSGVGLWFEPADVNVQWSALCAVHAVRAIDSQGRQLNGITAEATLSVPVLRVRQAVLSSIRELRDYQSLGVENPLIRSHEEIHGNTLSWSRDRLDGDRKSVV